jgi:hypothetical protein
VRRSIWRRVSGMLSNMTPVSFACGFAFEIGR